MRSRAVFGTITIQLNEGYNEKFKNYFTGNHLGHIACGNRAYDDGYDSTKHLKSLGP